MLNRRFIKTYLEQIERMMKNVHSSVTVRESDINTIVVGMSVGYSGQIPAHPGTDSVYDYYIQNHSAEFENLVNELNEHLILDFETALDIAKKTFIMRYSIVHEPFGAAALDNILAIFANAKTDFSPNTHAIFSGVGEHQMKTLVNSMFTEINKTREIPGQVERVY